MKPRVVVRRIDVGRHRMSRWKCAPPARAARPPPPAPRHHRPVAISSENTLAAKSTGVPCVPRYTGATMALPGALALSQQGGDDVGGQPRLVAQATSAASVSAPAPRRRPRSTSPARPPAADSPRSAPSDPTSAARTAASSCPVTTIRSPTCGTTPSTAHRTTALPCSSSKQLLPPHPPRQPRRQNDPGNQTLLAPRAYARDCRTEGQPPQSKGAGVPVRAPERMLH